MATLLSVGDIAIVQYNSSTTDSFTFVFTRDVEAGTVVNFTDNGWLAAGGFRPGEGTVTYTAAAAVTAGTIVTLTGLNLDDAGDQIIAYQGDPATPTILHVVDLADGNNTVAGDATNDNTTALPPGFTLDLNAVAVGFDNAIYAGPNSGSRAELSRAVSNSANWINSDSLATVFKIVERPDIDLDADNSTTGGRDYRAFVTSGGSAVKIADSDIDISDLDGTVIFGAEIHIRLADFGDVLSVNGALPTGITASLDPLTGVLTLSGEASHDAYEAAIRQIEFSTTQPIGTQKRISVTLFDGLEWGPEAKAFITVGNDILGSTTAPVLDLDVNDSNGVGADYTATFASGGPEIPVADTDVSITDADSAAIESATITLAINREPEDVLSFTGPAGPITAAYDSAAGILTLTGSATLAEYQTALRQVVFSTTSTSTADRIIQVTVNDGTFDSNVGTTLMHVVANVPPALNLDADSSTIGGVDYLTTFTDGGPAVAIVDTDVLITDSDDTELTSATLTLTNPHTNDVLLFNGTPPTGITASPYDPLTGILTLTGTASLAAYQTALRQITFANTGTNPSTDTRIIDVVVNDGTVASNLTHAIIHVAQVNNTAPVVDLDADDSTVVGTSFLATFTEGGASIPIADIDTLITDTDSTTLASATITLTDPQAGDLLAASGALPGGITASAYDPVTGILTLSGVASFADYETALEAIRFSAAGDNPVAGNRIIQVVVNDGIHDSQPVTSHITVVAVNDAPINTVPAGQTVAEDTILPIAGVSVADIDSSALTTTLSVANGILNVTAGPGVTGNGTASVTIAGTAAQINAALAGLAYAGNPDFNGADTLTVATSDGTATDTDTIAITVNPVNDAPINSVPAAQSVAEDTTLQIAGVSVADIDSSALITTLNVSSGILNVTAGAGVAGNGSASVSITGTAAQINAALAGLAYTGNLNFNGGDTLTVVTDDGTATDTDTIAITVNPVNDAPVLNLDANSSTTGGVDYLTAFTDGGPAVAIVDTDVLITDSDDIELTSATVTLTNPDTNDVLVFNGAPPTGIAASLYDPVTGILTLTGTASLAAYQTALLQIRFDAGTNPSTETRIIDVVVNDGTVASNLAHAIVEVVDVNASAPTVDLDGDNSTLPGTSYSTTFTENGLLPEVAIADADTLIGDPDIGSIASATITLTNPQTGDLLTATLPLPGGITASAYDPLTGTLTLSNSASFANYEDALEAIGFSAAGDNPVAGNRIIQVVVNDGVNDSQPATSLVTVVAVNDAPINSVPGGQTVAEDTTSPIAGVSVADVDSSALTTTLSVANGILNVTAGAGVSGNGSASASVSITGTAAQINAALAGLTYTGNPDFNGGDTLTVVTGDGTATDTDTIAITVTALNDAPINTVPAAQSVAEDATLPIAGVSVADSDSSALTTTLNVSSGILNVTAGTGAVVTDNGTASVSITGTAAQINAALAGLAYTGNLDFNGADTLAVVTDDGTATDTDTIAITVNPVNDAPALNLDADSSTIGGVDYLTTFVDGGSAVAIVDTDVLITDSDDIELTSATVTLTNPHTDDVLVFNGAPPTGIAAFLYDPLTGILTLTGTASLAAYQTALQQIRFDNTGTNPSTETRIIDVVVNDGTVASNLAHAIVEVTQVDNIAPVVNLDADDSTVVGTSFRATFTEGGAPIPIADIDTLITDADSTTLASATIKLTDPQAGDLLAADPVALPGGISASSYNPVTGILTLSGVASLADYETALEAIRFSAAGENPVAGSRIVEVVVNDGANNSQAATALLTVVAVNDAPALVVADASYQENADPVLLSPSASLTDADNTELNFAAVQITAGSFPGDGDTLTIGGVTSGIVTGITFLWNPTLHALELTGASSPANYQALLQTVAFQSTSHNPTDFNASSQRTLTWSVSDGADVTTATTTLDIVAVNDAPQETVAATAAYTENGPPVTISPAAVASDVDNSDLVFGVVRIAGGWVDGDVLTVNGQQSGTFAGIDFSYDAALHALVFSQPAPVADFQTLMQAVQFGSTSENPTNFGANPTRTLGWGLHDGDDYSSPAQFTQITINAVDDPAVAQNDAVGTAEDTAITTGSVFANNGSGLDNDPDGGAFLVTAVSGGTLGTQLTLPSGALLTLNADGTFSYDPNHLFDYLPTLGSGASNLTITDTFSYAITGGDTATVTVTVSGVDTNDVLYDSAGIDSLAGGILNDVYYVHNTLDVVTEAANAGSDTVAAFVDYTLPVSNTVEVLNMIGPGLTGTGTDGAETFISSSGPNTLIGLGDNDTYYVNHVDDVVIEAPGGGIDTVLASVNYTMPADAEGLYMMGSDLTGTGSNGAETLYSSGGPNTLVGLGGDDLYYVNNAADVVIEAPGGGVDTVLASVDYTMPADAEGLYMMGSGLTGTGTNNADSLLSSGGPNTLVGLGGDDLYYVDNAADVVIEAANGGFDSVRASLSYTLPDNVEALYTVGTGLTGTGNSGANTLVTIGANTLVGLGGDDTFVFFAGSANGATVTDFSRGQVTEWDFLVFSGFGTEAQGATFTQVVGTTDQWQIHSGLDLHNETITFSNHAALDFAFV